MDDNSNMTTYSEARWYDQYPAGGTIRGSLNLPAQSLYPSLPMLYTVVKAANIPKVIWYCGSSRGSGNRAAGWFQDLLTEKGDNNNIASLVLVGGIAGWIKGGAEYTTLVDEYDPEAPQKS
ncbi:hypothetical protein K402DRAFT_416454 [Aulographum hederae CBS 113979]|uniref:Rhodanese domain-containing protein n=1 Tax=Aulographum hederae CBS 113979 TaxID=1176131 RepID=A0A6G1HFM1_9PEZI|nr:hypothetical protein K402DRAFT_416454 [Aulographum hederae CBS 113979]